MNDNFRIAINDWSKPREECRLPGVHDALAMLNSDILMGMKSKDCLQDVLGKKLLKLKIKALKGESSQSEKLAVSLYHKAMKHLPDERDSDLRKKTRNISFGEAKGDLKLFEDHIRLSAVSFKGRDTETGIRLGVADCYLLDGHLGRYSTVKPLTRTSALKISEKIRAQLNTADLTKDFEQYSEVSL